VIDRFKTGPAVTAFGALLLVLGGVLVVVHVQTAGTVVAAAGGLIVVRERIRTRKG
jgi:drug/metabolite transporter superfamily protein YnfA